MSELKMPNFMQAYLDQLDGDGAHPEFNKLARAYEEAQGRVKNNAGYYRGTSNTVQGTLDRIKKEYEQKAFDLAKKHGFNAKAQENEPLKPDLTAKQEKKDAETKEAKQSQEPNRNQEAETKISKETERARIIAQMKLAKENSRSIERQP